jgi:acetyltransferase-like isoleucine patch superfamily enzyme
MTCRLLWVSTITVPAARRDRLGDVTVEDRVWVECGVMILKGITISRDSVVAAGAVLVESVPPYSLLAGKLANAIRRTRSWNGQEFR